MPLKDRLGESWYEMLKEEFDKAYFKRIASILRNERDKYEIYPSQEDVFKAYRLTPFTQAKVVIIGQDPYYNRGEANGLAFSVNDSMAKTPPSLQNIFNEIERNFDFLHIEWSTDLTPWANQGVFLLNRYLTVRQGQALSHMSIGWEKFTNRSVELLNISPVPIVFMLWGNTAKQVGRLIDKSHHLVLTASHPSPRSSHISFDGCEHFSKCNNFLIKNNQKPINWKTTL